MPKKFRVLKSSPPGKLARATVKQAIVAVHVFPAPGGRWEVKEIGTEGLHKQFSSQEAALTFAKNLASQKRLGILFHDKLARLKVGPRDRNIVYEVTFDEP